MSYADTSTVARIPFRLMALALAVLTGFALFLIIPARQSQAAPATLFAISPTSFDFGDVPLNAPTSNQLMTVTNVSGTSQTMDDTGGAGGSFGGRDDCQGKTLAPGASCDIAYAFAPTFFGVQTSTVTGALNGQSYSVALKGNGINQFLITPTALDFGNVPTNTTSASQTVTITNVSDRATSDATFEFDGGSDAFPSASNCTELDAGASCQLTFQFAPSTGGEQTKTQTGSFGGQSFSISLTGEAQDPGVLSARQFLITPTSLDFGDVPLNNSSTSQDVTVTNVSGAAQMMDGTDGGATVFSGSNDCQGQTLAAGASCHMTYQFNPTSLGAITTASTDMGNWNGSAFSIHFSGTGINQFLITPIGFDFGDVVVGTTSASQSLVFKNVGSASADVFLGGAGIAPPWGFSNNCKNATLTQGETCQEDFTFAPTTTGQQSTTLDNESINDQAYTVALTGNGVTSAPPPPPAGPVITSITPSAGPTSGGTSVTINGTGFTGATTVRFGSVAATFRLNSSTKITAVAPAQAASTRDISVKTSAGTSAAVAADKFTYQAAPKITSITPVAGPTSGGTSVTITGTGFTGATTVRFGSVAAMFRLTSSTKITAVAPAQGASTRDISVKTPGGTSAAVAADRFTYQAAPKITSISPSSGPKAGGTSVTITGTGFTGATTVRFGSVAAMFRLNSSTKITAVAPAQSAATRDIQVTTPGGVSATSAADRYTYH